MDPTLRLVRLVADVSGLYGPLIGIPTESLCSLVSTVSLAPMAGRCKRATFSSRSFGSRYTWSVLYLPVSRSFQSSSCASVWFVKEVQQAAKRQHDDAVAIREDETVLLDRLTDQ